MITRVELRGLLSYGDEVSIINFEKGKNVIVGENATGKSAFLTSIELGFFGSSSGWNLGEFVNDAVDEGQITIDFIHPRTGSNIRISRSIEKTVDGEKIHGNQVAVSLQNLDTGETLADTPSAVDRVLNKLGVDKNTFSTIIHIKQGKVDGILESSREQRNLLDRLLGIEDLESAYRDIGGRTGERYSGVLKGIASERESMLLSIREKDELVARLEPVKDRVKKLSDELNILEKEKSKLDIELSLLEKTWVNVERVYSQMDSADRELLRASTLYEKQEENLNQLLHEATESINSEKDWTHEDVVGGAQDTIENTEALKADITKCVAKIGEVKDELLICLDEISLLENPLNETMFSVRSSEREITQLTNQIERISQVIDGHADSSEIVCELCGSQLAESHYNNHLAEIRLKLENEIRSLSESKSNFERISGQKLALEDKISTFRLRVAKKDALEKILESIEQSECKLRQYKSTRLSIENDIDEIVEKIGSLLSIKLKKDEVKSKVLEMSGEIARLPEKIASIGREMELKRGEITESSVLIATKENTAQESEILKKKAEECNAKLILISNNVRPSLRDVQPIVRRVFLDQVNIRAMEYFSKFYSNESKHSRDDIDSIWVDDEYRFWASRYGHRKTTSRLSGGQRIVVSLSFLFAFLDQLGGAFGFLLLDEPSSHLDEKRIHDLVDVLKEIKNVPQLIIVDHREELIQSADVKYRTSLKGEFSTINPFS